MKWLVVTAGLAAAASAATYARYESLHPCDWLERDMTHAMEMPEIVVEARIRAAFLLRGITEPGPSECLTKWWDLKAELVPEE